MTPSSVAAHAGLTHLKKRKEPAAGLDPMPEASQKVADG
jgi:hypothetical protein